jgi:hypothetical protein
MSTTNDPRLDTLLDAYGQAIRNLALRRAVGVECERARANIVAYLATAYLRLPPPLDGGPVEMEEAAGDDYQRRGAT